MKKSANPKKIELIAVSSSDHYVIWNSLSVETLAGDLRGKYRSLVDVHVERVKSHRDIDCVINHARETNPEIVGISVEPGSLDLVDSLIRRLISLFHSANARFMLVVGNQIPTYYPEYFVETYENIIVVRGEGEESLRGLVECCMGRVELRKIPNLVYKNAGGEIIRTSVKTPNLNRLIYPPSLDTTHDIIGRGGTVLVQTSRGCHWSNCIYCTIRSFRHGKKWESLPLRRVISHLKRLVKAGISEVEFCDDDFLGGRGQIQIRRAYAIAGGIERIEKELGVSLAFRIFLTPSEIYIEGQSLINYRVRRLLKRLKQVGLNRVYFGIESGSPSQLRRYCREANLDETEKALTILRDLDIGVDVGFIMFDPKVTIEEILQNIAFFRRNGLIFSNQWPFRPLSLNLGSRMSRAWKKRATTEEQDIAYMSIPYRFEDERVDRLFRIIDDIATETRWIFYALKQISKRHFRRETKDSDTDLAQRYVERNGEIYLDLMEWLAMNLGDVSKKEVVRRLNSAKKRVRQLVVAVSSDIRRGAIEDYDNLLATQIEKMSPN